MSQKTIIKICRYASQHGHKHLSLEKDHNEIICRYDRDHYLRLPKGSEVHIISLFRKLLETEANDYVYNKNFKIIDGSQVIKGTASISPAKNGDKLNISLSTNLPSLKRFSALGLNSKQKHQLESVLAKKNGLIIISAPEKNGLSSSYYSFLNLIDSDRAIYSLEDFPEYLLKGASTIKPKKYGGIKASLELLSRLDTDVIACDAKLSKADLKMLWNSASSRLVIIAQNSSSPAEVLKTLKAAGLSSDAIAERLLLITNQRLFTKQCIHCLKPFTEAIGLKKQIIKKWPIAKNYWPSRSYINFGCKKCQQGENLDKIRVFEMMDFDKNGKLLAGYHPLIIEALKKAERGIISLEKIADWAQNKG